VSKESDILKIEHVPQSFKWKGVLGACIQTGAIPGQIAHPNGDCILLDFEKCFFGLSDSSDRYPLTSRKCLLELRKLLPSIEVGAMSGQPLPIHYIDRLTEFIAIKTENLLREMKGFGTCTLTAMQILSTKHHQLGLLMHTGDSNMYEYNPTTHELVIKTRKNFWMVGRTNRLHQICLLELKPGNIIILTTDGITPLHQDSTFIPKKVIGPFLKKSPVEDIPHQIIANELEGAGLNDDAAVIAFMPKYIKSSKRTILIAQEDITD